MGFLSVNILNRRKLIIDNSAEYIMRCSDALKRTGIPHEVHTKRLRSYVPNIMCNPNMLEYGISQKTMSPQDNLYAYTIFVPRRYLKKARAAVSI